MGFGEFDGATCKNLCLDQLLTLSHQQASSHGSRLIAFFDKMLTLGHLQASLHGSRLIAFLHRSDFGDVGGSSTHHCVFDAKYNSKHSFLRVPRLMEIFSPSKPSKSIKGHQNHHWPSKTTRPPKVIKQGIAISASAVDVQACHKTSEALP